MSTYLKDESKLLGGIVNMELEEMVKKIKAKPLREEAKKRGIPTHCVNKLDLAKSLPVEIVEELVKQSRK
jgi:hypothetical protein